MEFNVFGGDFLPIISIKEPGPDFGLDDVLFSVFNIYT
jgi:hypothetical protein